MEEMTRWMTVCADDALPKIFKTTKENEIPIKYNYKKILAAGIQQNKKNTKIEFVKDFEISNMLTSEEG